MTILITGSKRGLGHFLAEKFITDKFDIITHGRENTNRDNLNALEARSEILCDLTDITSIDKQLETLKTNNIHLHHLICNAGKSSYKSDDFECFRKIPDAINDNLFVVTNIIASALKDHSETLRTVTIIGSICGEESINGAPLEYSVSKSSLKAFTKLASKKLAKHNIRVNLLTPGNLLFENSVWDKKKKESPTDFNNYITSHVPINRIGGVDDIYNAIKFLISEESNYITGANFIVDGGQTNKW